MKQMLKRILYRVKYANRHVKIKRGAKLYWNSEFEGNNLIGENTTFGGRLGFGSYIGSNSCITGKIGKYTCIADNVSVVQGTHPTKDFVSIHPAFFSENGKCGLSFVREKLFEEYRYADDRNNAVVIGNDVWIGYGAIIIAGVRIGNGAVIAAGAVVAEDIPPYAIVGGIPAKVIRYRFDKETISSFERVQWWDIPYEILIDKISKNKDIIKKSDSFIRTMELTEAKDNRRRSDRI